MFKFIKWIIKSLLLITGILPLFRCNSGYKERNGKIYFNGKEITDKNFVVLNDAFAKDLTTVYYKENAFRTAHAATFEALDENYAKDKNQVYYCDEYREGQNYYLTKKQTINIVDGAIPTSFKVIDHGYAKDHVQAYFQGTAFKVKDIDGLQSINMHFVKDNVQAYLDCKPVAGSDGKTFEVINYNYAKDSTHFYFYGYTGQDSKPIFGIDCNKPTFEILDYPYAKDNASVYHEGKKIKNADVATFKILASGYAVDKNAAYLFAVKIEGADPNSFYVFKENENFAEAVTYSRDATTIFFAGKKVPDADLATFKPLGNSYGVDSRHVYFEAKIIKGALPASFKVYPHDFGDADAEDAGGRYHSGKKLVAE